MVGRAGIALYMYSVYVDMTLTRSRVKVKVTDHLNFRQLPITARFFIASATFEWSSKLMDHVDSMGPDLQPVVVRFSNFLLGKVSLQSIFHDIHMATYFGTA